MRIFVGNLHVNTSESMLRDLFMAHGKVLSVTIAVDKKGTPEGYGDIEMKESDGLRAIKQLNKINFMNQFLNIYETGLP